MRDLHSINVILNFNYGLLSVVDLCDQGYCQNGGTCDRTASGSPSCSCTEKWTGETCEERAGKILALNIV